MGEFLNRSANDCQSSLLKPKEYGQTGGRTLNPGFLNIYQVLYQLSYLAWGNNWDGLSVAAQRFEQNSEAYILHQRTRKRGD